jgi:hypothetical protein
VSQGGGVFPLLSSHTYATEGNYTFSVQVLDVGSASIAGSRQIRVSYPGPSDLWRGPGLGEGYLLSAPGSALTRPARRPACRT